MSIKIINQMKKRIVADLMRIQPDKIILFGSFASKRFRNGKSDIDLLIIKDTHRKYTDRISEARLSLTPNYPFDVFVLTKEELEKKQKESFFFREIVKSGEVLYEKH